MPIKQKTPIREEIPGEFAHFMREVAALIEQGDSSALIESDDLLQCERAYGGLYDVTNGRYGFAYYVNDDDEDDEDEFPVLWYFDLDRQQIREVATGKLTRIDMWRCESHDCGRRFPSIDYCCEECDSLP